jgi:hypothetical protein
MNQSPFLERKDMRRNLLLGLALVIGLVGASSVYADGVSGTADLIYVQATGQVILDPTFATGGYITTYVLQSAGQFLPGNFIPVFNNFTTTATVNEISETDLNPPPPLAGNEPNLAVPTDLGQILFAGLSETEVQDILTTRTYVGELGSGELNLKVILDQSAVPLPAAAWAGLALLGLGVIRRRRA